MQCNCRAAWFFLNRPFGNEGYIESHNDSVMSKVKMPVLRQTKQMRVLAIWKNDLVVRLDAAIRIASMMLADPQSRDPVELLERLINLLAQIKAQALDGSLTPPDGKISLGLARYVTDWVDDLTGPLHQAVGDIEAHYSAGSCA
jgi:hypothetical protein